MGVNRRESIPKLDAKSGGRNRKSEIDGGRIIGGRRNAARWEIATRGRRKTIRGSQRSGNDRRGKNTMRNQRPRRKRRRTRGRNESRRRNHRRKRRTIGIRSEEMIASFTNLKIGGMKRHGRGSSIRRGGVERFRLQWNINLKTIWGERIMMGNIRTERTKSPLTQTKAARLGTTIGKSDGEWRRQRRKRDGTKLITKREIAGIIRTGNHALHQRSVIRRRIKSLNEGGSGGVKK